MLLVVILLFFIIGAIISCKIKLNIIINNSGYNMVVYIFIFEKICVFRSSISNISSKFKGKKKQEWLNDKLFITNLIRKIKFKADILKIKIKIGIADAPSTAVLTGLISSAIGFGIEALNIQINKQNYYYRIFPSYSNQKELNIKFKCIISQNLVHIINIIYRNVKDWRCVKNGRKSSNRRAYGNSYE